MKKLKKAVAVLSSIAMAASPLTPAVSAVDEISPVSEHAIYVAADGSDSNGDGSIEKPYATIYKARDAVREINDDMTENITIYFRGGTYYLDQTIELGVEDSGTNDYFVEYKAYPGEQPIFNGGKKVEGWKKDSEYPNLYSTSLERDKKLRYLYVNDKRAYMPSRSISAKGGYGKYTITEGQADWAWNDLTKPDGVKFDAKDLPADIRNPQDIEVQSQMTWNTMTIAVRGVETIDDGSTVALFEQPYGALAQNVGWAPYKPSGTNKVFNIFEDLDEPGEFYFDHAAQKLYYYPREGEDMATAGVYAPELDTLLSIEGTDLTTHASHIKFDGIIFENTDWMMHEVGGSHGKVATQASLSVISTEANDWHCAVYRGFDVTESAIRVTSADNIYFCNNTVRHTANDTLSMINDVTDSVVEGNIIYDTGSSGMSIGHPQHAYIGDKGTPAAGEDANLFSDKEKYDADVEGLCRNIKITNNYMRDLAKTYYGSAGMIIYYGEELLVQYNYMENAPYSGISLGWGWGHMVNDEPMPTIKNNKILNNRIIDTLNILSDGGAIYTLGPMEGTEISGNYLSKVGENGYHNRGIHIDEGTAYLTGRNNVIEVGANQAAIDCGKWGAVKGSNTFDNNYSTSSLYTTTGNYESGTTITNKHVNTSGLWSDQEPISIIRDSGLRDEYINRINENIQDMVLPASYRLAAEAGISEISVPEITGEVWLAPEGTTEFEESDTIVRAKNGTLAIPAVEGVYRVYVIGNGTASEPSRGRISTESIPKRTDVIGPYWAQDVENHQGSKGSLASEDFGKSQNINDSTSVFDILKEDAALTYNRINGLDSEGSGWIGYLEKTVNVSSGGNYTLYILCYGNAGRRYNVFVDGEKAAVTDGIIGYNDSANEKAYSSDNCLNILEETVWLTKGDNTIRLQGDGAGPNFVAMGLVKAPTAEPEIPTDGLQLWLRADDGVTTNADGKVIRWQDKSGNGHDAASAEKSYNSGTGETDPEYVAEGENREPAVRFDGQDDVLEFPFEGVIADKENVSVIIVSKNTSDLSGNNSSNINGDNNALLYFHENGSWGKFAITPYQDVISVRMPEDHIYHVDKADEDKGNGLSTSIFIKEGVSATVYDKNTTILDTIDAPLALSNTDDSIGYLGGYHVDSLDLKHFQGEIAEIIVYDSAIALAAVQSINAYLNDKYYTPKPSDGDTVELTGGLDIFNGKQTEGIAQPGSASKNKYIKNVFGSGGWQVGNTYQYGVDDDYRAAFDGTEENVNQYFDGPAQGYCGVEFLEPQIVTKIGFQARNGANRLNGAVLQGSRDGTEYEDIYTIQNSSDQEMRYADMEEFDHVAAYPYIRLIRKDKTVLNLYELKLYTIVGLTEDDLNGGSKISGDVNLDGKVTSVDALLALKMVVSDDFGTTQQRTNANVIYDDTITTEDVLLILQYASGEKTPEGIPA